MCFEEAGGLDKGTIRKDNFHRGQMILCKNTWLYHRTFQLQKINWGMLPSFNKYCLEVQTDPQEESGCKERQFLEEKTNSTGICFLITVHPEDDEVCVVHTVQCVSDNSMIVTFTGS